MAQYCSVHWLGAPAAKKGDEIPPSHQPPAQPTISSNTERVVRHSKNRAADGSSGSWLFCNSGRAVKLSVNTLAGCRVLSAVDTVITVNRILIDLSCFE
jgi:hypothetical protein